MVGGLSVAVVCFVGLEVAVGSVWCCMVDMRSRRLSIDKPYTA